MDSGLTAGTTYAYRIRSVEPHAEEAAYSDPVRVALPIDVATVIDQEPDSAAPSAALHIHPNPFNGDTSIRFSLDGETPVRLQILDIMGQVVRELVRPPLPGGHHRARWDGRDDDGRWLASGLYLCRLQVGTRTVTRKMLLLR